MNHYIAVTLAILAVLLTFYADLKRGDAEMEFNIKALIGDGVCLASSFLMALSTVLQERQLKEGTHKFSLLGSMGLVAFFITSFQAWAMGDIALVLDTKTENMGKIGAYYLGFVVMNFTMYSLNPVFI